jgi:Tfp pilus assembly protein PilV
MRSEDGFTIVEVLVAATILVVGVITALQALDSSRRLTLVAERQTTMAHRAQQELERLKSLPYSQVALTTTSSSWSTSSGDATYVSGTTGSCPGSASAAAPQYQSDPTQPVEPLVINGCSYTINGATTPVTGGSVAPVTGWQNGSGSQYLSGSVYDFVTWSNDPTCAQTASPGSICPTTNDYKRITVVVTANNVAHPSKPAVVSAYIADPNAIPIGAPANSAQNPIASPNTTCVNGQGQTVSCSNTLIGTPNEYFLTDTPSQNAYAQPACSGNTLHQTFAGSSPSPDLLVASLPPGTCTDSAGNPTPPCFASDSPGCATGIGGLPIVPSGSSSCGTTPPSDNTKTHAWVTPQVAAGSTLNLNGTGSMTAYLESTAGAPATGTLCIALYTVSGTTLTRVGSPASVTLSAPTGTPSPVSFTFNVGGSASVANPQSLEVVLWLAGASSNIALVYDQTRFPSEFTLIST